MSRELAMQVIKSPFYDLIDYLISEFQGRVPATLIANTVVNTMKSLQRDGVDVSVITEDHLKAIFNEYAQGVITKEAIPDIIAAWSKEPDKPISDIINKLGGLRRMSLRRLGST